MWWGTGFSLPGLVRYPYRPNMESQVNREDLMVRTSERASWMQCRMRWYWGYVERLTPNVPGKALSFGTLMHQALAVRYPPGLKRGPHPAPVFRKLLQEWEGEIYDINSEEEWVSAEELGVSMLNGYVKLYGKDERFRVIAPEQDFQILVYDDNDRVVGTLVGTFDIIVQDLETGKFGLMEHKTCTEIPPNWLYTRMDEQAGTYLAYGGQWAAFQGIIAAGIELDFILYNFLRKAKEDTRPVNELGQALNKNGSVSKLQPIPRYGRELVYRSEADRINQMIRTEMVMDEIAEAREGKQRIYKHPTDKCKWMCEFKDMCELHEAGADWEQLRDLTMTRWNPYADHEGAS